MKPAAYLIVDATAGHLLQCLCRHVECSYVTGTSMLAEHQPNRHSTRKFLRSLETSELVIKLFIVVGCDRIEHICVVQFFVARDWRQPENKLPCDLSRRSRHLVRLSVVGHFQALQHCEKSDAGTTVAITCRHVSCSAISFSCWGEPHGHWPATLAS